jgi:hypothetical protein
MRPLDLDPAGCPIDPTAASLTVFPTSDAQEGAVRRDPVRQGTTMIWHDVPFGPWVLKVMEFAPGYDRYLIPGRSGLNAPPDLGYTEGPNEGYLLPIDAAYPRYDFDLYVFRAFTATGTVRLAVRLWQCPAGVVATPEMSNLGCEGLAAAPPGFRLRIMGRGGEFALGPATPNSSGHIEWGAVPRGEYMLQADLNAGATGYAVRSEDAAARVHLLSDRSGYALILGSGTATPTPAAVAIDVYLLH